MPVLNRTDAGQHRRDALGTAAIILGTAAAALIATRGDAPAQDAEAQCRELLGRFVELRLTAQGTKVPTWSLDEHRARALSQAEGAVPSGRSALASCGANLTEESATCARGAPTIDAFERCFP